MLEKKINGFYVLVAKTISHSFAALTREIFIYLKVEAHNLTTAFPFLIPAHGICIQELKAKCIKSSSVFYGCVQRSLHQAKQMQQVNEPLGNENNATGLTGLADKINTNNSNSGPSIKTI